MVRILLEPEYVELAVREESGLKGMIGMLTRATGLRGVRQLLSKRAEGIHEGTDHDNLGSAGMMVLPVRLRLNRTGTCDDGGSKKEEGAWHLQTSRRVGRAA